MHISMILLLCAVGSCWAELQLLMSVFRHGNRYPTTYDTMKQLYPRYPLEDFDWFPDLPGGLTEEGKLKAFELGQLLREIYGKWVEPIYSKNLVTFRSSHVERCIVSASIVAAGLFPPNNNQKWNHDLNWQPISVLPYPHEQNMLFYGGIDCENYHKILETTRSNDSTIGEYDKRRQDLYDFVSNQTGGPVNNRILSYLNIEFMAMMDIGLELPPWVKTMYDNGYFIEATVEEYIISSWTDELKRFTGGVWLKEWLDHVNTYLGTDNVTSKGLTGGNQSFEKQASFYAGHEINIAGILVTLGIFNHRVPNYASAVNFELHDDDNGQFYVKILHRDSGNFTEYIIPGCGSTLCPLNTFKDIFANVIPLNPDEDCGRHMY